LLLNDVNTGDVTRLYREERLMVRRRGGRKRAVGTRAPMTISLLPNERWSIDFAPISSSTVGGFASWLWSTTVPASVWR
jgi:hypothetical protein